MNAQIEANARLTEQLAAALSAEDGSWQPLKIQLVTEQGEPVQGSVTAQSRDEATKWFATIETDHGGIADFEKAFPAADTPCRS